jgi:hypothetical protein
MQRMSTIVLAVAACLGACRSQPTGADDGTTDAATAVGDAPSATPAGQAHGSGDGGADAGDSAATPTPNFGPPAYPDDPAVVGQITAMGDNSALWLDSFRYAGDRVDDWRAQFGTAPNQRDFSNKLAYADDRGTALYAGGNHGAPHVINDAWEYHLGSNTWHLLFYPDPQYSEYYETPGARAANLMIEDGYLQTKRHGPVVVSHTWDGLTYDPGSKRLMWANVVGVLDTTAGSGSSAIDRYAADVGMDPSTLRSALEPATNMWMYDPGKGRWFKQTGGGAKPLMRSQGAALEYVAHLQKSLWYVNQWDESGMWLYDSQLNTWEQVMPNDGVPMYGAGYPRGAFPPAESQLRYSAKHRTVVAVRADMTWEYSFDTNRWTKVVESDPANAASDASSVFAYDPFHDVFLLMQPALGTVRAYQIGTKAWTTLVPTGAGAIPGRDSAGYFDTRHNVLVVYDQRAGKPWLYRYKR